MEESSVFKWRIISAWHGPVGAFYSRHGNIFTEEAMLNISPATVLGQWVEQVRKWGFNGMSLDGAPDDHPQAFRNFARYIKERGMGLFIKRAWCQIEVGFSWPHVETDGRYRRSKLFCPYSDEVRAYWADQVARDFEMIPDLAGYHTFATEFYQTNGTPWMCDCNRCQRMTPRERVRDAIRLIAGLLEPYGGTYVWETSQDAAEGQRHEVHYFKDLTGQIPENAFITHKRHYYDHRTNSYPRHPLFEFITKDAQGRSPYICQLCQPGEYRGLEEFPWCAVDEWSGVFRDMLEVGQHNLWVNAFVRPNQFGWDHPLNMVNWYALERYMKDPYADPAQLKLAWAKEQFGLEAAPVVVEILGKVTKACRGMLEFDAQFTSNHSRFPTLEYLDSHLCGPYGGVKRMAGMMGMTWPLDMYPPQRAAQILADPKCRLLFTQHMITPKLKAEAMGQKNRSVRLMEEALDLWQSLEGKFDQELYEYVLASIKGNLDDTKIFRNMMDLYMDWKLSVLTEEKIDQVLAESQSLRGIIAPDPMAKEAEIIFGLGEVPSLAMFAEQLRQELREPWVEKYWQEHPLGVGIYDDEATPGYTRDKKK